MIWFLLLLSCFLPGWTFSSTGCGCVGIPSAFRAFVWFAVFSDALPIVVVMLLKAVPDYDGLDAGSPMVSPSSSLLLIGCRYGYYFGLLFDRHRVSVR